jgi:hypothetical protein
MFVFLAQSPWNPVHAPDVVDYCSPDPKRGICLKLDTLGMVKLINRIQKTEHTVSAQIVKIHMLSHMNKEPPRNMLYNGGIVDYELLPEIRVFARSIISPQHIRRTLYHSLSLPSQ